MICGAWSSTIFFNWAARGHQSCWNLYTPLGLHTHDRTSWLGRVIRPCDQTLPPGRVTYPSYIPFISWMLLISSLVYRCYRWHRRLLSHLHALHIYIVFYHIESYLDTTTTRYHGCLCWTGWYQMQIKVCLMVTDIYDVHHVCYFVGNRASDRGMFISLMLSFITRVRISVSVRIRISVIYWYPIQFGLS